MESLYRRGECLSGGNATAVASGVIIVLVAFLGEVIVVFVSDYEYAVKRVPYVAVNIMYEVRICTNTAVT